MFVRLLTHEGGGPVIADGGVKIAVAAAAAAAVVCAAAPSHAVPSSSRCWSLYCTCAEAEHPPHCCLSSRRNKGAVICNFFIRKYPLGSSESYLL